MQLLGRVAHHWCFLLPRINYRPVGRPEMEGYANKWNAVPQTFLSPFALVLVWTVKRL